MLSVGFGIFVQMIYPKGILPGIHFPQQTTSEHCPFSFSDLTFKNRLLHSNPVILTGSRYAA